MLDFRIETFICVCKHMNFTHAANELHITQPAVSQHIKYLQKEYDKSLFHQKGKQLSLTEAGKQLLTAVTTVHHDEMHLKNLFAQEASKNVILNFGATLTVGQFMVPEKLAFYLKQTKTTSVHMTIENTNVLCKLLDDGEIDFAVVEGNFNKTEYDFIVLKKEKILPVCSPEHHFAKEPEYLADLTNETLVIREKLSGGRNIIEGTLESCNLTLSDFYNIMEINNISAIKILISQDCGITFLYETAVAEDINRGLLRTFALKDFNVIHDINFIWRKNSAFTDTYRTICKALMPH